MRSPIFLAVSALVLFLSACAQPEVVKRDTAPVSGAAPKTFEVKDQPLPEWDGKSWAIHEWGTFTGVQGSNGVALDGLCHEEHDLPDFVHDIRDFSGIAARALKMETPVIYFYGPEARRVGVNVKFPHGVITQWYPAAHKVNHCDFLATTGYPALNGREITDLMDGYINWGGGHMLVLGSDQSNYSSTGGSKIDVKLPEVEADDPWRFCREVDANSLRVCGVNAARFADGGSAQPALYEYEKCLFYRGLGEFSQPLKGEVCAENVTDTGYEVRVKLTNLNPAEKLGWALVIYKQGDKSAYQFIGEIEREYTLDAQLELEDSEVNAEKLITELASRLTETGLYHKEALAMARTWQHGYFRDDGLRVLYVMPREFVDRELPLEISNWGARAVKDGDDNYTVTPAPIVRTFVARQELLSPSREAAMEATVAAVAKGSKAEREQALAELDSWGRFATPYLNRVKAMTTDKAVLAEIDKRLEALKLRR